MWTGAEPAGVDFVRLQADLEEGAQNALNRIVTAEDRAQLKAVTAVLLGHLACIRNRGLCQARGDRHHPHGNSRKRDGAGIC